MDTVSGNESNARRRVSVGLVPTPTKAYASHAAKRLKTSEVVAGATPGRPSARVVRNIAPRIEAPASFQRGCRALIWKQDPTVEEIGISKTYLPTRAFAGPKDARLQIEGLSPVSPNALGDFIVDPSNEDAFDAVHTYAVVRQTLTMLERARGGAPLPWQWNSASNTVPIGVHPHAGVTMNAYYSRNERALKFFYFADPNDAQATVFTCRSLDIVAHEAGHAVLDGLKPGWLLSGNPPQTGGLHESFGDLVTIFLALSQLDQVEAIVVQTRGNLHRKNLLADVAEQFGDALGRPNGLRNADNDFKLSQVGNEVHAISQVFTGGVYDVLADIYSFEQRPHLKDDAAVLHEVGQYVAGLVLRAILAAPAQGATYAHVVNKMLALASADGKPSEYGDFIKERFTLREVLSPQQAGTGEGGVQQFAAAVTDEPAAFQNRTGCCGTMQRGEFRDDLLGYEAQVEHLRQRFEEEGAIIDDGREQEVSVVDLRQQEQEKDPHR